MESSFSLSTIIQGVTVLYVAWLTASLWKTDQNMDKYVENYVSTIKIIMKDSHYLSRFMLNDLLSSPVF